MENELFILREKIADIILTIQELNSWHTIFLSIK
jgi:hypothetical protein